MSSGPKNVTSTTSSEPPAFILPALTNATNAASADFNQQSGRSFSPAPQGFPSGFPSGFNPLDGSGFPSFPPGGFPQPGTPPTGTPTQTPGSALIGNSQSLLNDTLQGRFLTPDNNPFLESTFNRAADLTRGRLDSEFSGAGRNLAASQPARSDELQTLASNIFGDNFESERNRQIDAIGQSQAFDPLNQFINRLAGIIPGAGGVTSSTQPVFRTGLF
jgi:hypothetical protein